MKKTVKVNIGGFSYNIDEDAYSKLNNYIEELKSRLGSGNEAIETLNDIEERISELFAMKMGQQNVVTIEMVNEVINQLGNPDEITGNSNQDQKPRGGKQQKRLYRNPENSIIGGVCSGLSEYFSVDPIVIRLVFVLLLFAKGFGLILYIVLWIATPRAITPRQKLEMKGEPITFSNIEKNIKEELHTVSNNVAKANPKNFFEKVLSIIGQITLGFLKVLLVIIKVIAIIIGVTIVLSMIFAFLAVIGALFFGQFMLNWISPELGGFSLNEFITSMFDLSSSLWVTVPVFLILIIPVIALIYGGLRIIFRFKARDGAIGIAAAVIWVASVVALAITVFLQARSLTIRESVVNTITLNEVSQAKESKIILKSYDLSNDSTAISTNVRYGFFDLSFSSQNGKKSITGKPELIIEKSDDSTANITLIKKARGGSKILAKQNASEIIYNYTIKDSIVTLDPVFTLPENCKWKNQDISLVLNLPEGCSVYIDSTLTDLLDYNQPYCNYWPDEMVGKTWTMTKNGLRVKR